MLGPSGHPHDALGVDLRIAEALAILRGRAGRRVLLGEGERLGVELADLAGALGDPGVALRIDGDVVRLGVGVDEVVRHHAVVDGLAGQQVARHAAVGVVGVVRREGGGEVVHDPLVLLLGQIGNVGRHHARAHAGDGVLPVVEVGAVDGDALHVVA